MHKNLFLLTLIALFGCSAKKTADTAQKTEAEIWDEVCATATIEETCSSSGICHKQAVIPKDIYCQHFECPLDLADYEERFSTCDPQTEEWPQCGWTREVGCGVVQYTAPHDESSFHTIAFDEEDGEFLGLLYSSDSPLGKCDADDFRVETFTDYFYRREPACENIQENLCCHRDPPHLW